MLFLRTKMHAKLYYNMADSNKNIETNYICEESLEMKWKIAGNS